MNTKRNDWAMVLVGITAMIGIFVLFTLMLQPAVAPAQQPTAQAVSPDTKPAHINKVKKISVKKAPAPAPVSPAVKEAAQITGGLLTWAVIALFISTPFAIRRWKIKSRARYQAEGWLEAKDRHDAQRHTRRLQEPF